MMNTTKRLISKLSLLGTILLLLAFVSCQNSVTSSSSNSSGNSSKPYPSKQSVGYSAHDLLASSKFSLLDIQMQYAGSYKPTQQAVDSLKTFLERRLHKPGGIHVSLSSIPSPGKSQYTNDDIVNVEDHNRTIFAKGDTIAVYYFFADGNSSQDSKNSKVLGLSYFNTSIVIFEKTIRSLSGGVGQPSTAMLEATVMRHEFGHILGLVNIGTPMVTPHEDQNHKGHCTNKNCLMYYNVNTSDVVNNVLNSGIPQLGPDCRNDLQHNGGK
ncbi:MAG TPA: hypothetical protein VKA34_04145 [Balneolales bacterium]|nr:hypothetical protein [Balneolales bacterium]